MCIGGENLISILHFILSIPRKVVLVVNGVNLDLGVLVRNPAVRLDLAKVLSLVESVTGCNVLLNFR